MGKHLTILALLLLFAPAVFAAGKKTVKPTKPYGGSPDVYCDPVIVKQFDDMWRADEDGRADNSKLEYGFRIDWINGHLEPGPLLRGEDYKVTIPVSEFTIAIAHTHPNAGVSSPSTIDMNGDYPDYVVSRDGLWVTRIYRRGFDWLRPYSDQFSTRNCPYVKPVKKKKVVRKRGKKH